mmetsp:Transcript_1175/g.4195  ORF Transcript_1175/g.4195 Transcript_1175/m.4195 type:complete len:428 (+) Transcript_1175:192-1475(+)
MNLMLSAICERTESSVRAASAWASAGLLLFYANHGLSWLGQVQGLRRLFLTAVPPKDAAVVLPELRELRLTEFRIGNPDVGRMAPQLEALHVHIPSVGEEELGLDHLLSLEFKGVGIWRRQEAGLPWELHELFTAHLERWLPCLCRLVGADALPIGPGGDYNLAALPRTLRRLTLSPTTLTNGEQLLHAQLPNLEELHSYGRTSLCMEHWAAGMDTFGAALRKLSYTALPRHDLPAPSPGRLQCLEELCLTRGTLEELPAWVGTLPRLRSLAVRESSVRRLFATAEECLPLLEKLDLSHCEELEELPSWVACLPRLRVLHVGKAALRGALSSGERPAWAGCLAMLRLGSDYRTGMQGLGWIGHLQQVRILDLTSAALLPDDEPAEGGLQQLVELNLSRCTGVEEVPAWVWRLPNLRVCTANSIGRPL